MLPRGLLKEYAGTFAMIIRIMDMLAVLFAGWLAFYLKFDDSSLTNSYLYAIVIGMGLTPLVFAFFNVYTSVRAQGLVSHFIHLTQAVFVLIMLLAGLAFFTKTGTLYSRVWFGLWMALIASELILYRCIILLFLRFMRTRGLNERRIIIIGAGELGTKFAGSVQQALWTGFRIVTFLDDHAANKPKLIQGIPVQQTPANLEVYLMQQQIDEIWLALPLRAEARVKEVLRDLRRSTINIRFLLNIFGMDLLNHSLTEFAGFPVLNLCTSPMMGVNRFIKALEDRWLAALILTVISPLLLLIAIGVKCTSKGPVFFKQKRLGWDGRVIKVYKFRTMKAHQEAEGRVTQATIDDARITPLGKFLRRTSLDELPQFINVLQGRMSIVGPRPHALAHNEIFKNTIDVYMQRHRVKPGITGWAQVNGWRGETDTLEKMQKRVEYDLYYINHWSLWFDIKIIGMTLLKGFVGRNAY